MIIFKLILKEEGQAIGWIQLVQDRVQWWRLTYTVMNHRVSWKAGHSLIRSATVRVTNGFWAAELLKEFAMKSGSWSRNSEPLDHVCTFAHFDQISIWILQPISSHVVIQSQYYCVFFKCKWLGPSRLILFNHLEDNCRSQWPRGLRLEPPSLARTLRSWVRIPLKASMSLCVYSVFVLFCV
jgi:hypothetical protein